MTTVDWEIFMHENFVRICVFCLRGYDLYVTTSTFGLLLLWKKFFPAHENWRMVKRDMLWPSNIELRQLPGVYLGIVACLLVVFEKRQHHHKEGWRARYHT